MGSLTPLPVSLGSLVSSYLDLVSWECSCHLGLSEFPRGINHFPWVQMVDADPLCDEPAEGVVVFAHNLHGEGNANVSSMGAGTVFPQGRRAVLPPEELEMFHSPGVHIPSCLPNIGWDLGPGGYVPGSRCWSRSWRWLLLVLGLCGWSLIWHRSSRVHRFCSTLCILHSGARQVTRLPEEQGRHMGQWSGGIDMMEGLALSMTLTWLYTMVQYSNVLRCNQCVSSQPPPQSGGDCPGPWHQDSIPVTCPTVTIVTLSH